MPFGHGEKKTTALGPTREITFTKIQRFFRKNSTNFAGGTHGAKRNAMG